MSVDVCSVCERPVYRSHSSRPEIVCHRCRRERRARFCEWCGRPINPRKAASQNLRGCSLSCGQKLRHWGSPEERGRVRQALAAARQRRKRATKRSAVSEPYTLPGIAERDGYRCGLCGRRVVMDLVYNDPKAATIDHIVPMSRGGDNTRANVQLAHRDCNLAKHNRGGGEQLRLVG